MQSTIPQTIIPDKNYNKNQKKVCIQSQQNKNCQSNKKNCQQSFLIGKKIIEQILNESKQRLILNRIVKQNIRQYSYNYSKILQQQIVTEYLNKLKSLEKLIQQQEPSPLIRDNLNPIFAEIQYKQQSQESQNKSKLNIIRNMSIGKKKQLTLQSEQNTKQKEQQRKAKNSLREIQNKIEQKQIEQNQDKVIQAMRVLQLQKSSYKAQNNNKKNRNNKEVIKKDQKISYDYSGQVIKVKSSNKPNFISHTVEPQTNLPAIKVKETKALNLTTTVDNPFKRDLIKRNMTKKQTDIQFSAISNLANEVKVLNGVKFVYGNTILEKNQKSIPLSQLKKNASGRKLSKNQFERLKSLGSQKSIKKVTENTVFPPILRSQPAFQNCNNSILSRSVSQSKINTLGSVKSRNKSISKERILIQNEQLTQYLLQKVHNTIQQNFIKQKSLTIDSKQNNQSLLINQKHTSDRNLTRTASVPIIDYMSLKKKTPFIYRKQKKEENADNFNSISDLKSKLKEKKEQQKMSRLRKNIQNKLKV